MSTLEARDSSKGKDGESLGEVKPKSNKCLMITLITVGCVVVVGLVLGLSLGLTLGKKSKKKKPIVVIVAMKVEFEDLLKKVEKVKTTKESKYTFYEGTINKYPVVICHCGVNEINAGIATLLAIQKYDPLAIINEGTAGGYGKSIHQKDIVVGVKALNLASFKSPSKAEGQGSNSLDWELISFFDGEDDRLFYHEADESLVNLAKDVKYDDGNVHFGAVGSSDNWNSEADRILHFNSKYKVLCEEMECVSVYAVAKTFNVPVIGIKVISNNDMIGESFDTSTAVGSQKFTYELILKMI